MVVLNAALAVPAPSSFLPMDPLITPAPELFVRQAVKSPYPALMGYWPKDISSTEDMTCKAATWSTWSTFGNCCSGPCTFATGCVSNNRVDQQGVTRTCPTSYTCGTITVFSQSPPAPGMSVLYYPCLSGPWSAFTLFREVSVATTSDSTESISTTSSSPSQTTSLASASASASSALSISPTPSASATSTSTPSKSNAWIAGAVIGPVVGLAIILGLLFWIFRLKHPRPAPDAAHGKGYTHSPPHDGYGSYQSPRSNMRQSTLAGSTIHPSMYRGSPPHSASLSELPSSKEPTELAGRVISTELPSVKAKTHILL